MKVKQLIEKLKKMDKNARVVIMADHDGNNFFELKKVDCLTDDNEGATEWDYKNGSWKKGDVVLDYF
jgi:hypothetical protein